MDMHTFEKYLIDHANSLESLIQEPFSVWEVPDMGRYLYEPLSQYSANAGKRHRPLICMLACKAVGGDPEMAKRSAIAIEHFHTAALIHDDIADESELRRGAPCMHITMGEGLAINAGDLALSLVTGAVLDDMGLEDAVKLAVLRELVDMTTRTIEGQALDLGWARDGRYDITIEDYLVMAQHKTAFYSGAVPLAIGGIIGGATDEQVAALRAYGMSTGLAFQIQDDVLNLVGTKEATKKDFRGDITEGKRTMIAVHALAHAQGAAHDELLGILSSHETAPEALARAVELMEEAGSIAYAREYARHLVEQDRSQLKAALPASASRTLLLAMGDFFVSRLS